MLSLWNKGANSIGARVEVTRRLKDSYRTATKSEKSTIEVVAEIDQKWVGQHKDLWLDEILLEMGLEIVLWWPEPTNSK
jgi:hypothetical protein